MTVREALERNWPFWRPCGCTAPFREWPGNVKTLLFAWLHGRSYANWDGFLTRTWEG